MRKKKEYSTSEVPTQPLTGIFEQDAQSKENQLSFYLKHKQHMFIEQVAQKKKASYYVTFIELFDRAFNLLMEDYELKNTIGNLDGFIRHTAKERQNVKNINPRIRGKSKG